MSVTTSFTFKEWPQADGKKWVHFVFKVNGQEFNYNRKLPGATDSQTYGIGLAAGAEADAAQQEIGQIIAAIDSGTDSLTAVQGATLSTVEQCAAAVVIYGATERHLDFLYKLESLVNYLTSTYTQDQLVTVLALPLANVQALVSFYQAALPAAAQLHANQSLIQGV